MQDVADLAGVAIGTVSNALNHPERLSPATRARVDAAIADLGFVRNSTARNLAAGRSDTVGLVLVDIGNSFFVDIARGAERAATDAGFRLLLANSDVDRGRQDGYLELFDESRAAGLLLAPMDAPLDAAHAVRDHGRPIVLVNAPVADAALCSVLVDDHLGGRLAAGHLIEEGCTRLGFAGGPFSLHAVRQRRAGAEEIAAAAGIPLDVIETAALRAADGRQAARELLTTAPGVDGLICCSDAMAVGAIGAADELGIDVPSELAVIGYDDNHFAAESALPVSTIGQPGARMGELAMELLLEEIDDPDHRHRSVLLEPFLIRRISSRRTESAPAGYRPGKKSSREVTRQ